MSRIQSPDFKYAKDKVRFLVFLENWEPGQIFQFGNYVHTQWKKGEIVTWEWSTLPHATWNGSWTKRPALQITGTATANTWKKIKQGVEIYASKFTRQYGKSYTSSCTILR